MNLMTLSKRLISITCIIEEYIRQIVGEARTKFNVPAIAITVMNSDKINIKEIQGTRVIFTENTATLKDYFYARRVLKLTHPGKNSPPSM